MATRNGVSNALHNEKSGVTFGVIFSVSNGTPTQPFPTRPDPTHISTYVSYLSHLP